MSNQPEVQQWPNPLGSNKRCRMTFNTLDAMKSLAQLQAKFRPDKMFFDTDALTTPSEPDVAGSSDSVASASSLDFSAYDTSTEPANAKIIDYRGEKVAGFELRGKDMICLPQVYELFLKNMVGGLHTVYTKLKRLDIQPIICNVEQVRALRGLGAIQPGVNRCKLIATTDFDLLYDDCTNTCTRPGRPPKRASVYNMEDWAGIKRDVPQMQENRADDLSRFASSCQVPAPLLLGQFLPQFNTQQLLMQHLMTIAQQNAVQLSTSPTPDGAVEMSLPGELAATNPGGAPLNLTKTNSSSDSSESDATDSSRKNDSSLSPNQFNSAYRGGSSSASLSNNSPSSDQSNTAVAKIINLIDLANEQFKQHKETLDKDRQEVEFLRTKLRSSLVDEEKLRTQLDVERKRGNTYFRRYCKLRREVLELKETVLQIKDQKRD